MAYVTQGCNVFFAHYASGETVLYATAENSGIATSAMAMLNKAHSLNSQRKYSASCRTYHAVERMEGLIIKGWKD